MTSYLEEEVEEKKFMDLAENPDFQRDLIRFFSGSRYGMSREEIAELGPQGLADKFVEHMRWQSTNEYTALQDLSYVRDRERTSERELQAFGGLITAFDRSAGGGTGMVDGAIDYISAFVTSPSTGATVATGGWGIGSKLAARAAGKSAQALVRSQIADLVQRQVATRTIQDTVAGTVRGGAVRGAVASAVAEGAIGAGQGAMLGEIREETTGVGYGTGDLVRDGLISATIGGALGSATRALDVRTQRRVVEEFATRESAGQQARAAARQAANERVAAAPAEASQAAAERAIEVANILSARESGRRLDPLSEEFVAEGNRLRREILGGTNTDEYITQSLSVDTLRGVTAATLDLLDELGARGLNVGPNERITSAVVRGLQDETNGINPEVLNDIRAKYNLSREEFSYIYLSDLSRAGRVLGEASIIARAADRAGRAAAERGVAQATQDFATATEELADVTGRGLSSLNDRTVATIVADTYDTTNPLRTMYRGLQEADSIRIAFMTSQLGTTMANAVTSAGNLVIDMSNQFWKNFASVTYGRQVGDQVQRNWMGGTLSTLRGMTLTRSEARITRGLLEESYPLEYRNLFFETGRAEAAMEGQSFAARVGRFVNTMNSATDSVFKQASFYSGLDRRLREVNNPQFGTNISEFLATGRSLDDLPQQIVDGAMDDARRFTFQRSYYGDESAFGQAASALESAHQKLPFVISAGVGVPFPRYIANHLEHINDYTLLGVATGGLNRLDNVMFGDQFKTGQDRFARQMTGMSLVLLGYSTAASTEGEVFYDERETETGVIDISRTAGPWLANFFIGDLLYRWRNDMPYPEDLPSEMLEIAGGMGDLGFDTSFVTAVVESVEEKEFSPDLQRFLGDIAATFTYPLTIARDFQGMLDPASAPTPFTRDVMMGPTDRPSLAGEATAGDVIVGTLAGEENYLDVLQMRASRMLPDWSIRQQTQTLNGRNDIPTFSPFSGGQPVGAFNPLSRQFGFSSRPRPTEIQREMARLNIREFDLYSRRKVPNPAVAWVVEARLSQNLNDRFQVWAEGVEQTGALAGGVPYNEVDNLEQRRNMFTGFVEAEIRREVEETEHLWNQFRRDDPRAAAGFIRNLYVLEEAKLSRGYAGDIYDDAVRAFSELQFGQQFDSARDFIVDSDTIEDELARREKIMTWAEIISSDVQQLGR
jgi:hypothetical protein